MLEGNLCTSDPTRRTPSMAPPRSGPGAYVALAFLLTVGVLLYVLGDLRAENNVLRDKLVKHMEKHQGAAHCDDSQSTRVLQDTLKQVLQGRACPELPSMYFELASCQRPNAKQSKPPQPCVPAAKPDHCSDHIKTAAAASPGH